MEEGGGLVGILMVQWMCGGVATYIFIASLNGSHSASANFAYWVPMVLEWQLDIVCVAILDYRHWLLIVATAFASAALSWACPIMLCIRLVFIIIHVLAKIFTNLLPSHKFVKSI